MENIRTNNEYEIHKKEIIRPDIKPQYGLIKITAAIAVFWSMCLVMNLYNISLLYAAIIALFIVVTKAKKTIIWLILLYQKYAPESVRQSCLFEPTCSNYMLLAIDKYGLLKGMTKGIKRLLRCHPPNGGIDNP